MQRRFNLRLWVVMVTLTTVILVHAGLALVLSRYVAHQMIAREGAVAQEFLNSILKAEGTADVLMTPKGAAALTSFSRHITSLPGLLRANIYGPDRVIRFSTDQSLLGTVPEETDDLDLALAGQFSSSLNSGIGDTLDAKLPSPFLGEGRVIEAYLPLTGPAGIVGVVEYYRDAGSLQDVLTKIELIVWAAAALSGLVIIAALYGAAMRATRKIDAQTTELQSLSVMASLGQMAAAVTHSLRNPLASIRSSVELLQVTRPGLADDTVAEVIEEVDRIDRHVTDLLDFAGSDQGQGRTTPLAPLVASAVARIAPRADRAGISFDIDMNANLGVHAVAPLLMQVLENVLTNAIEAMHAGGPILIRGVAQKGRVRLSITDQGLGFPAAMTGAAPVPFVTTKQRGLGLGLSIAERLLARFDAELEIANATTGGGCVTLVLKAT